MTTPTQPDARPPDVGGCTEEWSDKLAWYVNQTLEAEETDRVEAHLATCDACRGEVAELRSLQQAVVQLASQVPEPSEAVFERVMERVEAYEAGRVRIGRLFGNLLSKLLPPLEMLWQPALRPAVAVAGLVILLQAVAIGGLLTRETPTARYRTLTGGAVTEAPGPKLQIAFHGETPEQAIRDLLREVNVTIVGGPSSLGIYVVALHPELRDEEAINSVVARLRTRSDVVRFVERLP